MTAVGFAVKTWWYRVLLIILQPSWLLGIAALGCCCLHKAHPTLMQSVRYILYQWKRLRMGGKPDPFHKRIFTWIVMAVQANRRLAVISFQHCWIVQKWLFLHQWEHEYPLSQQMTWITKVKCKNVYGRVKNQVNYLSVGYVVKCRESQ